MYKLQTNTNLKTTRKVSHKYMTEKGQVFGKQFSNLDEGYVIYFYSIFIKGVVKNSSKTQNTRISFHSHQLRCNSRTP